MPPSPLVLHILLALTLGDNYGAAIRRQIMTDSRSTVIVGEANFYRILKLVQQKGYITEAPLSRLHRRVYRLTPVGHRVLKSERARSLEVARLLRERLA